MAGADQEAEEEKKAKEKNDRGTGTDVDPTREKDSGSGRESAKQTTTPEQGSGRVGEQVDDGCRRDEERERENASDRLKRSDEPKHHQSHEEITQSSYRDSLSLCHRGLKEHDQERTTEGSEREYNGSADSEGEPEVSVPKAENVPEEPMFKLTGDGKAVDEEEAGCEGGGVENGEGGISVES